MRKFFDELLLPPGASSFAYEHDTVLHIINAICLVFFIINMGIMGYYVMRYRFRSATDTTPRITHNNTLEVIWTVIPTLLLVLVFWLGYKAYMDVRIPPGNAMDIYVTGKRWAWDYKYPNGTFSNNGYREATLSTTTQEIIAPGEIVGQGLVVPAGRPIRLVMHSEDVLHSYFVPAFRIKQDVVPNRYSVQWFEAREDMAGKTFPVYCAEYCGTSHSRMLGQVHIKTQEEYNEWVKTGGVNIIDMKPEEYGKFLYEGKGGCFVCHSIDGKPKAGPTFKGIWGHEAELASGGSVMVDEEYVRESLRNPTAKVVKGFNPTMPVFGPNKLTDDEIEAIIAFLKTVQ